MKTHEIGGNFMVKYFGGGEGKVSFPSSLSEIREGMTIKVTAENGEVKEFPYSIEKLMANAYRGFSLQHQGGSEGLSDEEKTERKEARKAKNAKIKKLLAALEAKGQNIDAALAKLEEEEED